MGREVSGTLPRLRETDMAGVLKAIRAWRADGMSEQFFRDPAGRLYAAAFLNDRGQFRSRPGFMSPWAASVFNEFFARILSERGRLFRGALAFVGLMTADPSISCIGSLLSWLRLWQVVVVPIAFNGSSSRPSRHGAYIHLGDLWPRPFRFHSLYGRGSISRRLTRWL